jgi:hypothetical protein
VLFFCNQDETIQHLFFDCPLARIIWHVVHMTVATIPPTNMTHLFEKYLFGVNKKDEAQICVGDCALVWAIWNAHNDIIFNKPKQSSFLQVIPQTSH